jgi:mRNA interferase RelE/StbE
MLELDLGKQAVRFLKKLSSKQEGQIWRKLSELQQNPYPQDSRKLQGFPYFRADCGEYRIVYITQGAVLVVRIIGKRNDDEVYKKLERMER